MCCRKNIDPDTHFHASDGSGGAGDEFDGDGGRSSEQHTLQKVHQKGQHTGGNRNKTGVQKGTLLTFHHYRDNGENQTSISYLMKEVFISLVHYLNKQTVVLWQSNVSSTDKHKRVVPSLHINTSSAKSSPWLSNFASGTINH